MIHYTLLPEKEIKTLKKEYRTRLAIFLLFFLSSAVLLGIGSLAPAYIYSYAQEKEALNSLEIIHNNRQKTGVEDILKDLGKTNEIIKKIKGHQNPIGYSDTVSRIISHKSPQLHINSFQFSSAVENAKNKSTTTVIVILQGKADTRDRLIEFKTALEEDALFSKVELPLSDLAKSKDIPFSFKLSIIPPK